MMSRTLSSVIMSIVLGLISVNTMACVVIDGSRIVFNGKDRESVVQLKNNGDKPYLLQLWIDHSDPTLTSDNVKAPFIIIPSITHIEAGKKQAIRILSLNPTPSQTKETLFFFNIFEIPPKPDNIKLPLYGMRQSAFRTRIKLFYRPENLYPAPSEAYNKIEIKLINDSLNITNSSPYFITFSKIEIKESKDSASLASVENVTKRTVEPKGEITFPLSIKAQTKLDGNTLFYSVIDDYGEESVNEKIL